MGDDQTAAEHAQFLAERAEWHRWKANVMDDVYDATLHRNHHNELADRLDAAAQALRAVVPVSEGPDQRLLDTAMMALEMLMPYADAVDPELRSGVHLLYAALHPDVVEAVLSDTQTDSEPVQPDRCPTCGSDDRDWVADCTDPVDPWHSRGPEQKRS